MPASTLTPPESQSQLPVHLFFAAAAALASATFLPWFTFTLESGFADFLPGGGTTSGRPGGGGVLYLLLFATAYAGAGYALRQRVTFTRLRVAMWAVNAWMVVSLIVIASALRDQSDVLGLVGIATSPSVGVFVAAGAVLAGIAGSAVLQRSRAAVANG